MVIGIQLSAWPAALQARLDIKGPDTLSLIATSVFSAGSPHGPPDVSQHGRYYDLASSLYTPYHHLCELPTYC